MKQEVVKSEKNNLEKSTGLIILKRGGLAPNLFTGLNMHSLQELMADIRKDSDLCEAIEWEGVTCFKKKYQKNKYCCMHIWRKRKYKSFSLPVKEIKKCKFIDCKNKHHATGYCKKHHQKFITEPRNIKLKCTATDCQNYRVSTNKLCSKHRFRLNNNGTLDKSGKERYKFIKGYKNPNKGKSKYEKCIVPNCEIENSDKSIIKKGLCSKHYMRWYRTGTYNIASKKEYEQKHILSIEQFQNKQM